MKQMPPSALYLFVQLSTIPLRVTAIPENIVKFMNVPPFSRFQSLQPGHGKWTIYREQRHPAALEKCLELVMGLVGDCPQDLPGLGICISAVEGCH